MFKTVRGRLITVILMVAVAGWQWYSNGLKLGLDLQGGMHLVLEVDDPEAYYLFETRMGVVWPVDAESGKLVGEETYTGTDGFAGIAERKITEEDIVPLSI